MNPSELELTIAQARQKVIPPQKLVSELQRELNVRYQCYPRWVQEGKLSAQSAAHRIVVMEQAIEQLQELAQAEQMKQPQQMSLLG